MKMTIIERYAKLSVLGHWKKKIFIHQNIENACFDY